MRIERDDENLREGKVLHLIAKAAVKVRTRVYLKYCQSLFTIKPLIVTC